MQYTNIGENIFLVHKEKGMSSFQLVQQFKRFIGAQKAGHAGTLDPLASGMMIIGIERGTKQMHALVGEDKVYITDVVLGESRTTGDTEGKVLEHKCYEGDIEKEDVENALQSLLGEHFFDAPLYSAVKVEGKPLYWYARNGKQPPFFPQKRMLLKDFKILDMYKRNRGKQFVIRLRLRVGSGTYIRTLAEVLGKKLGYPAHISYLYRFCIGTYCANLLPQKKENSFLKKCAILGKDIIRFFKKN